MSSRLPSADSRSLPPGTPSVSSSYGSAFDGRDVFTINHLQLALSSAKRRGDLSEATLRDERADWRAADRLYNEEINKLRAEIYELRGEIVHLRGRLGEMVVSEGEEA